MSTAAALVRKPSGFRLFLNGYLILAFLILLRFGESYAHSSDSWCIADWLISYSGGFIRRGLFGTVVLACAHWLHIGAPWLVFAVQISCYVCLLVVFRRLVLESAERFWVVLLALSPATIAFPLLNIHGGYRKEILFFATLSVLLWLLLWRRARDGWTALYLALVLPAVILSDESISFYLPYYFAALVIILQSWRRSIAIFLVPMVLCSAAAFVSSRHIGNEQTAQQVCVAAGYRWDASAANAGLGPCGGSIAALGSTRAEAHRAVLAELATSPTYKWFPLLALLAFAPILLGLLHLLRFRELRHDLLVLLAAMVIAGCGSAVLFYYAIDWGRWIYMHVLAAALLLLTIERRKQSTPRLAEPVVGFRFPAPATAAWVVLVIYALCWDLPHMADADHVPTGTIRLLMKSNSRSMLHVLGLHTR